jgi:hypothetical protein
LASLETFPTMTRSSSSEPIGFDNEPVQK